MGHVWGGSQGANRMEDRMKADQAAELNAALIIGLILLGVVAWLLL